MEKPAQIDYPILEILKRRWSPRVFADRMVEPEKLRSLFEAARWAPSSSNEQPWSFIVTTKDKPEDHARLLSCLVEKNQQWARTAPVLMVSVAKLNFDRTGKPNRHAFHDVGLAVGLLLVQATALDLFVHQMAGFSPEKVVQTYNIPAEFAPVAAIALGYGVEQERLPEPSLQSESAPVFADRWGRPWPPVLERSS